MSGTVDVPVYLQVEPRRRYYPVDGRPGEVCEAVVVNATTKRPTTPRGGAITIKVTLRIPSAAFDPLEPEAVVIIPTDLTDPHPIVVEATDPTEESS